MRRTVDEAGLDEDGEQAPPRKLTLSPTYNASDADIELQSKDGTRYLVHRANLGASSKTFAGMFTSIPSDTQEARPTIYLEESSSVPDNMLPYCYPQKTPPVDLRSAEAWEEALPLLACLDKYELWRGVESCEAELARLAAIDVKKVDEQYWPSLSQCFRAYAFARHFDFKPLLKSAKLGMLEAATQCAEIEQALYDVPLGVLGTSVGVERVALRLYAHLHAASRVYHRCNNSFVQAVDDHPHLLPDGDDYQWQRDSWESLFNYVTYRSVQTKIWTIDYEHWDCGRCRDAFDDATDELIDGLHDLFADFKDRW